MKISYVLMPALLVIAICGCDRPATPETDTATDAPAPAADGPVAGAVPATPVEAPAGEPTPASAAFVDKVWRVRESSAVAVDTRYSFLADGTLVIEGAGGPPPGYGSWAYADGALTMTEEGIAYPVDILALEADRFEIRSNNPGEPVTILLEADANAPLPASPPK